MKEITKSIKQLEARESNFIMSYKWLFALPPADGMMLAYLIDVEDIANARLAEDERYFKCTESFMQSCCVGWTRSNITTALKHLQDRNLIDVKNVHTTRCENPRFIKINLDEIEKLKQEYDRMRIDFSKNKDEISVITYRSNT